MTRSIPVSPAVVSFGRTGRALVCELAVILEWRFCCLFSRVSKERRIVAGWRGCWMLI